MLYSAMHHLSLSLQSPSHSLHIHHPHPPLIVLSPTSSPISFSSLSSAIFSNHPISSLSPNSPLLTYTPHLDMVLYLYLTLTVFLYSSQPTSSHTSLTRIAHTITSHTRSVAYLFAHFLCRVIIEILIGVCKQRILCRMKLI